MVAGDLPHALQLVAHHIPVHVEVLRVISGDVGVRIAPGAEVEDDPVDVVAAALEEAFGDAGVVEQRQERQARANGPPASRHLRHHLGREEPEVVVEVVAGEGDEVVVLVSQAGEAFGRLVVVLLALLHRPARDLLRSARRAQRRPDLQPRLRGGLDAALEGLELLVVPDAAYRHLVPDVEPAGLNGLQKGPQVLRVLAERVPLSELELGDRVSEMLAHPGQAARASRGDFLRARCCGERQGRQTTDRLHRGIILSGAPLGARDREHVKTRSAPPELPCPVRARYGTRACCPPT